MNRSLMLVGLTTILAGFSANAAASRTSSMTDNCSALPSNLEYTECWQKLAREERARVDSTFVRTRQVAQKSDRLESYGAGETHPSKMGLDNSLRSSQAEWTNYSDRQCRFEGWIARGGTGTRALVAKCQYRLNLQRVKELENAIKAIKESY